MNKFKVTVLAVLFLTTLWAFKFEEVKTFEFSYPKVENTTITIEAEGFKKFKKEWRGTDYYYMGVSESGIICSVLYYKLNDDEKSALVDAPKAALAGPAISPAYPFAYFKNYSNLKQYEKNDSEWGLATDDFMFRQNDITEFGGAKINQKHMYGYCMVNENLFVNIHLSKVEYTAADSLAMRQLLNTLKKVR
jgi:hypothetical protein